MKQTLYLFSPPQANPSSLLLCYNNSHSIMFSLISRLKLKIDRISVKKTFNSMFRKGTSHWFRTKRLKNMKKTSSNKITGTHQSLQIKMIHSQFRWTQSCLFKRRNQKSQKNPGKKSAIMISKNLCSFPIFRMGTKLLFLISQLS